MCLCGGITRAQRPLRANTIPHRVTWYRYEDDNLKEGCCRALLPDARRASTGTISCCRFSCAILSALRSRSTVGSGLQIGPAPHQRTQSHSLLVKCVTHGQESLVSISEEKWVPFSSFFNAGVRQIDIHVNPHRGIDEMKSMSINGDAVTLCNYWFVWHDLKIKQRRPSEPSTLGYFDLA